MCVCARAILYVNNLNMSVCNLTNNGKIYSQSIRATHSPAREQRRSSSRTRATSLIIDASCKEMCAKILFSSQTS